VREP